MDDNTHTSGRTDKAILSIILLGSLCYFAFYFNAGINWMDEGTLLTPVDRILAGQVPYRDFYRIYTPGRWWMFAALFYVFGRQFLITRIVWAVGHSIMAGWMYQVCRRAAEPAFAAIGALALILAPGPWHKTPFMLGMIAGVWLVVRYAAAPSLKNAAAAGLGAAVIFLFRQDAGAFYAALAGLFVLFGAGVPVSRKLSSAAALSAAFLFPTAAWMGYFFAVGGGSEMIRQIAFAGAKGFATNPLDFPRIFDPLGASGAANVFLAALGRASYYMPLVVAGLFLRYWLVDRSGFGREKGAVWTAAAASALLAFNQLRARPDFPHLWQAYPVVDLMAVLAISRIADKKCAAAYATGFIFLVVIAGGAFSNSELYHGSARVLQRRTVRYANPVMPVRLTPEENALISDVEGAIGEYTKPGDYIFLAPDIPLFYFLTGRRNPTPWDVVRPSFLWDGRDQLKAAKLIDDAKVRLIVIREGDVLPPHEKRLSESYPILYDYIMSRYELAKRRDDFKFYLRRPEGE